MIWIKKNKNNLSTHDFFFTEIIDVEMGKDPWYLTVGKTPLERVHKMLSKLYSIKEIGEYRFCNVCEARGKKQIAVDYYQEGCWFCQINAGFWARKRWILPIKSKEKERRKKAKKLNPKKINPFKNSFEEKTDNKKRSQHKYP